MSHPLYFLPAERSAQAAEAARQTAGSVMGAVREATLNTAQQTREMFDVLQQKTLDTVVRVLHMGQEKMHQVGQCAAGDGSVGHQHDAAGKVQQVGHYLHESALLCRQQARGAGEDAPGGGLRCWPWGFHGNSKLG